MWHGSYGSTESTGVPVLEVDCSTGRRWKHWAPNVKEHADGSTESTGAPVLEADYSTGRRWKHWALDVKEHADGTPEGEPMSHDGIAREPECPLRRRHTTRVEKRVKQEEFHELEHGGSPIAREEQVSL